ncbi:MAG: C40 family peptidase [Vicinamibacterales bacterium]
MHCAGRALRIWTMVVLAIAASACAARTSSPAIPRPAPFPSPPSPSSITPTFPAGVMVDAPAELTRTALSLKGVPYRWGGDQPSTGFDCSGFVQYVLAQHRIAAPRTSAEQFLLGRQLPLGQMRAGDLVFFSTVAPGPSHVGLALNSEEFVHAPAASGVVRVESVRASYWRARYVGARRIF